MSSKTEQNLLFINISAVINSSELPSFVSSAHWIVSYLIRAVRSFKHKSVEVAMHPYFRKSTSVPAPKRRLSDSFSISRSTRHGASSAEDSSTPASATTLCDRPIPVLVFSSSNKSSAAFAQHTRARARSCGKTGQFTKGVARVVNASSSRVQRLSQHSNQTSHIVASENLSQSLAHDLVTPARSSEPLARGHNLSILRCPLHHNASRCPNTECLEDCRDANLKSNTCAVFRQPIPLGTRRSHSARRLSSSKNLHSAVNTADKGTKHHASMRRSRIRSKSIQDNDSEITPRHSSLRKRFQPNQPRNYAKHGSWDNQIVDYFRVPLRTTLHNLPSFTELNVKKLPVIILTHGNSIFLPS